MAKCGYHPRMGTGLHEIGGGLVEAVKIKASKHSRSVSDQLSVEKEEFAVVRATVRDRIVQASSQGERHRLEAFGAMLLLGEYFLNLEVNFKPENLQTEVTGQVESFVSFLITFDEIWKTQMLDRSLGERAENALSCSLDVHRRAAA